MWKLFAIFILSSCLSAFAQNAPNDDHVIKHDKIIEETVLKTQEHKTIEAAQDELRKLMDQFHSKHSGNNVIFGEPETFTRTEAEQYEKGIYKTRIKNQKRKYKKKLKVRFRPMIIINKCKGNKIQFPIKFYTVNNGKKKGAIPKKVGTEMAVREKTYYKLEIPAAASKYETPPTSPKILYRESEELQEHKTPWLRSKENTPSHKPCEEYGFMTENHKGKTCAVDPETGGIYVITYDPNKSGSSQGLGKMMKTKEVSHDGGKTWQIIDQTIQDILQK